jgi:hypothetical protein
MATNPQIDQKAPRARRKSAGRPSIYSYKISEEICERLSEGESLIQICRDPHMPSRTTVLGWQKTDPDFRSRCAHAREAQGEWTAEDIAETERELREGLIDAQTAKVLISSKQWRAAKLKPKVYGDSTMLKHADANGEAIRSAIDPTLLSPDERDTLRQLILASQQRALAPPEEAEYEEISDVEEE